MDYDQKLDQIISDLAAVKADLRALVAGAPRPVPEAVSRTSGLYRFVKPTVRRVDRWSPAVDMQSADVEEALERALDGVNWRGFSLAPQAYDEAWEEIEALKAGDERLIGIYREANLDPEFAGFGLLTGLISPTKYDGITFGVNAATRARYAGETVQSFLDMQIALSQTGGTPSGS